MATMFWTVPPEWQGETAFVIAGGTSVAGHDLERLRGRRVIVLNSSYTAASFADILFFMDRRWWYQHRLKPACAGFQGRTVTVSAEAPGEHLLRLRRCAAPPGLTRDRNAAVASRTCLTGALNLLLHLGVARIVLLGADMARSVEGVSHHHEPHQWRNKPGNETWDIQIEELRLTAAPLRESGIEVINASPISRIDWWPFHKYEDTL